MAADSHPVNSAPRKALSAPLAASTPLAGAWRRPEALYGPHRAAQDFRPRPSWARTGKDAA